MIAELFLVMKSTALRPVSISTECDEFNEKIDR